MGCQLFESEQFDPVLSSTKEVFRVCSTCCICEIIVFSVIRLPSNSSELLKLELSVVSQSQIGFVKLLCLKEHKSQLSARASIGCEVLKFGQGFLWDVYEHQICHVVSVCIRFSSLNFSRFSVQRQFIRLVVCNRIISHKSFNHFFAQAFNDTIYQVGCM